MRLRRHAPLSDADRRGYCHDCKHSQLLDQPDYDDDHDRTLYLCSRLNFYATGGEPCNLWGPSLLTLKSIAKTRTPKLRWPKWQRDIALSTTGIDPWPDD